MILAEPHISVTQTSWCSSVYSCYHPPANCFSTVTPHQIVIHTPLLHFSLSFIHNPAVSFRFFCVLFKIRVLFCVFSLMAGVTARSKRNRTHRKNTPKLRKTRWITHARAHSGPKTDVTFGSFLRIVSIGVLPAVVTHVYPPLLWIPPLLPRRVPVRKTRSGRDEHAPAPAHMVTIPLVTSALFLKGARNVSSIVSSHNSARLLY